MVEDNIITVKCSLKAAKSAVILFFSDNIDNRISNFCLIHSVEALERSNPDPAKARITKLLNKSDFTAKDWSDLLSIISLSEFEDQAVRSSSIHRISGGNRKESKDVTDTESLDYETTTKDEFNKQDEDQRSGDLYQRNYSGQVYSFLTDRGESILSNDIFEENEEQKLTQNPETGGEGEQVGTKKKSTPNESSHTQRSIIRYLNKIERHYDKKIKELDTPSENLKKLYKVGGEALKDILIALQLVILFKEREFEVEFEKTVGEVVSKPYCEEGRLGSGNDTIKGFLLSVVGKFVHLCRSLGYEEYNDADMQESLTRLREDTFNKAMRLIHEISWNRIPELEVRKLLILNLLEYICPNAENTTLDYLCADNTDILHQKTLLILDEYKQWKQLYNDPVQKKED